MNKFFDPVIAGHLQLVTFPLEVIGVALALIEVRFPRATAWLTQRIERLATPMEELRAGRSGRGSLTERSLAAFLTRVLRAGLALLSGLFLGRLAWLLFGPESYETWLFGFLLSYLVSTVVMTVTLVLLGVTTFFFVVGSSDFVNRFVAGRAIGTLGILIASIGLLGELYQLMSRLLNG